MKKQISPGALLSPVPAVLVSCGTVEKPNLLTVAWVGTVCTHPAMVSISVRPERYSYPLIKESGEFVINLPSESMVRTLDFCGVRSGRNTDKFAVCGLTAVPAAGVSAPAVAECPVSFSCKVKEVILSQKLKTHPVCLSSEGAISIEMEKVLNSMPNDQKVQAQRVLEINSNHPIFEKLCSLYAEDKDKLKEYTQLLYDQALLIEGVSIDDPVAFSNRICNLMV